MFAPGRSTPPFGALSTAPMPAPLDLSADLPQYRVQGHVFTLRPTTPNAEADVSKVVADWQAWHRDATDRIRQYGDALAAWYASTDADKGTAPSADDYVTAEDERREWSLYFDVFCAITTGPHSSLDPMDFDAKVAEHALHRFLPETRRRQLIVDGVIPVSVD